jgi:hypothetical protein
MRRNWVVGIVLFAAFLLAALYGSASLFLPQPQSVSIPADQFSAERAMQHVQLLAQAPRVIGTPGMEQAAAYTAQVLKSCGLTSEIQSLPSSSGLLHNVVVRIRGSQPGQALLIVSHLDSVSYGAGDNASGAAVLLETACALNTGEQLKNDIFLLFEDGEEQGYLGGYAFAATDASMQAVRRVIGLDTAAWGPVVLLQTTPGNADFIQAYVSSVKDPTAFGFFAEADWKISADTSEVQPFYERDLPGLELEDPTAFTGKHSAADTVEKVRPGSLQQMGDQVLALTRNLGNSDLTQFSKSDQSYFSLWRIGLVHYPAGWNLVLALLGLVGLFILIGKGIRGKTLCWSSFLASFGILLVVMIGSILAGLLGSKTFEYFFPNPNHKTGSYLLPASLPFFLVVVTIVAIVYLIIRQKLAKRFGSTPARISGIFFWAMLSVVTALRLPVGSYIFAIPLLEAMIISFLPAKWFGLKILPAATATILIAPNVVLAFLGTGMETLMLVTLLVAMNMELWVNQLTETPALEARKSQG